MYPEERLKELEARIALLEKIVRYATSTWPAGVIWPIDKPPQELK